MERNNSNKLTFSVLVVLVSAAVMVAALFLPYAAAMPEFQEMLKLIPEGEVLNEVGMTAKSTIRVSMAEFMGIYLSVRQSFGMCYGALVAFMGIFAVLAGVFALLRKPLAVILCDVLAVTVFVIHNFGHAGRGVVPSTEYRFGIAYYLFYVAAVAMISGGIWLIKEKKTATPEEA